MKSFLLLLHLVSYPCGTVSSYNAIKCKFSKVEFPKNSGEGHPSVLPHVKFCPHPQTYNPSYVPVFDPWHPVLCCCGQWTSHERSLLNSGFFCRHFVSARYLLRNFSWRCTVVTIVFHNCMCSVPFQRAHGRS